MPCGYGFAGLGDPRSFHLEDFGEPWLGLWCLWGGRGAPGAQIELFELPVRAGVHLRGVPGGRWARKLSAERRPVAACGGLWRAVAGCGVELWPLKRR